MTWPEAILGMFFLFCLTSLFVSLSFVKLVYSVSKIAIEKALETAERIDKHS